MNITDGIRCAPGLNLRHKTRLTMDVDKDAYCILSAGAFNLALGAPNDAHQAERETVSGTAPPSCAGSASRPSPFARSSSESILVWTLFQGLVFPCQAKISRYF